MQAVMCAWYKILPYKTGLVLRNLTIISTRNKNLVWFSELRLPILFKNFLKNRCKTRGYNEPKVSLEHRPVE